MRYHICGIEITKEHAQKIDETVANIEKILVEEKHNRMLNEVRATLITNPHNTFQGTAEQYMEKYKRLFS